MKISLPAPSMVVLIGISGSGKSTFAREHFALTEIVSSDQCRALVCDDETNQAVNQDAVEILHLIAAKRLAHRKLTVIDATNAQPEARQPLLALARQHRIPAIALVFNFDVEICLHNNRQRVQRVVPRDVILQQQHDLQRSLATLSGEGFHAIYALTSPAELATASVLRKKNYEPDKSDLLRPTVPIHALNSSRVRGLQSRQPHLIIIIKLLRQIRSLLPTKGFLCLGSEFFASFA